MNKSFTALILLLISSLCFGIELPNQKHSSVEGVFHFAIRDSIVLVRHTILPSTSRKTLRAIKKQAISAGITYSYSVKYNGGKILMFKSAMSLKKPDGSSQSFSTKVFKPSEFTIEWLENQLGIATAISRKEIAKAAYREPDE